MPNLANRLLDLMDDSPEGFVSLLFWIGLGAWMVLY